MKLRSRRIVPCDPEGPSQTAISDTAGSEMQTKATDSTRPAPSPEIAVGRPLPSHVLDMALRARGHKTTTTLQEILNERSGDIVVHVFSRVSRKQLHKEYEVVSTSPGFPHIDLTSVGISTYPVSACLPGMEDADQPPFLLSDPTKHFLDCMGFVRPPPASKAVATRQRRLGPIRSGFFVVKKDGTLYTRQTGTLENLTAGIFKAERKLHKEWVENTRRRGGLIPPW
ncbi:hypothetical protein BDV12DRAFT_203218 [Aspergillus spectabilis]